MIFILMMCFCAVLQFLVVIFLFLLTKKINNAIDRYLIGTRALEGILFSKSAEQWCDENEKENK